MPIIHWRFDQFALPFSFVDYFTKFIYTTNDQLLLFSTNFSHNSFVCQLCLCVCFTFYVSFEMGFECPESSFSLKKSEIFNPLETSKFTFTLYNIKFSLHLVDCCHFILANFVYWTLACALYSTQFHGTHRNNVHSLRLRWHFYSTSHMHKAPSSAIYTLINPRFGFENNFSLAALVNNENFFFFI